MRPYEVMLILDAGLEDDAVQAVVDRSTSLIAAGGGTPGRIDRWGKRRFAYELDHRWEGIYILLEASAEPAAMADLDRNLHLADEVLRHKIIRLPDVVAGAKKQSAAPAAPASDGEGADAVTVAGDEPAANETVAADAAPSANGA